jgi:hypothetical protein
MIIGVKMPVAIGSPLIAEPMPVPAKTDVECPGVLLNCPAPDNASSGLIDVGAVGEVGDVGVVGVVGSMVPGNVDGTGHGEPSVGG